MREWNSKMISRAKYSIDMCHGPLLGKIVRFVIPLMAANMMQCLFSAVDLIVIGRYASSDAMAAVGSSGPLISAILSVFFGLSVGGNVLVARYIGAKDQERLFRTVHTVIAIALYGGVLLATAGWIISRPVLELMHPPPEPAVPEPAVISPEPTVIVPGSTAARQQEVTVPSKKRMMDKHPTSVS